jgi:hypothetical protein
MSSSFQFFLKKKIKQHYFLQIDIYKTFIDPFKQINPYSKIT